MASNANALAIGTEQQIKNECLPNFRNQTKLMNERAVVYSLETG